MKQIRQGDILLVSVNKIVPDTVCPRSSTVLAEGELTGHAHVLTAPEVYDWSENGQRYVMVKGATGNITHQEHDPIPAPVIPVDTVYQVIPQQEWDLSAQWRKVQD